MMRPVSVLSALAVLASLPALAAQAVLALVGHGAKPLPSALAVRAGKPAAKSPTPAAHAAPRALASLPMLPSVARVRVEAARDRVVVVEDVSLPRGEWTSGGLDLHVAFGAPGTPAAVDVHLLSSPSEGRPEDAGEAVVFDASSGQAPGSVALLGKMHMSGIVVHVRESQLRRAYSASDDAILRIRSLLATPDPDASGRRDIVVRLGAPGGAPITLGHIQFVSLEPPPGVTKVEAGLCGADADPWPLAVAVVPRFTTPPRTAGAPIAPSMAVRHASDDLCIRWWTSP
jgi:hypothetical protein